MPWHLLQAIWPGAGHPLPQMTAYDPLLRQLVAAGWEPLTGARVAPPGVRLERYGHGDQVYLVLHNPATQTATATATLDEPILGAKAWHATSEPGARPVTVTGGRFTVPLAARATVMVRLTR